MEEKLLYTSRDYLDIIQIEGILKENDIPYVKKIEGLGSYKIVSLGSFSSEHNQNIYVSEDNLKKAQELIQIFTENKNIEKEADEADMELEEDMKKAKLLRNILIYGFAIIPTLILLLIVILVCLGLI